MLLLEYMYFQSDIIEVIREVLTFNPKFLRSWTINFFIMCLGLR